MKHMINFLGAQYTGHMTKQHTHLICTKASESSEKYKKAKEWDIPVVSPRMVGRIFK